MYVKTFVCFCALLIATRLTAQTILPVSAKYNFNPGWKVFAGDSSAAAKPGFNDASWKNVTLPYACNEDDGL